MAALAYLLLPLTGLVVFLCSRSERARFHGLQAITVGFVWAFVLYGASFVSAGATQAVWIAGTFGWIALVVAAAARRDLTLPLIGPALRRAAQARPDGGSVTDGA